IEEGALKGPIAVTGAATEVTQTSATLNATVNPGGHAVTECTFEYGTSETYMYTVPCSELPPAGESPVGVSAELPIMSLSENTTYHYRIFAKTSQGPSYGAD